MEQVDYLKLYATFCSRQADALRAIRRNRANRAAFNTFILVRGLYKKESEIMEKEEEID
jgi:flagellar biosynthesis regulator FlbT